MLLVGFDWCQVQQRPGLTERTQGALVQLRVMPYAPGGGSCVGCSHLEGVLPIREGRAAAAGAADATATLLSPAHNQRKDAIAGYSGACADTRDVPSLSLPTRAAEEEVKAGAAATLKPAAAYKRSQRARNAIFAWPESIEVLAKWSIRWEEARMSTSLAQDPFAGHVQLGVFNNSVLITSREHIRTMREARHTCSVRTRALSRIIIVQAEEPADSYHVHRPHGSGRRGAR